MIRLAKSVSDLKAVTVASNGTNGILVVDTRPTTGVRFEAAEFRVALGPGASTAAPITLELLESNDTNATNYSTVMPFVGGSATSATVGFVLPSLATSAGSQYTVYFNVNLRKTRKRYLKVSVVPGTTASVSISAALRQPNVEIAPNTTGSGGDVFLVG
jgi:hypothetical protein